MTNAQVDNTNDVEKGIVNNLIQHVQDMKAGYGQYVLHNAKQTQDLTVVISVYDKVKPAHMVLDELYAWAEKNNPQVKHLIRALEQDMSWNHNHRV